MVGEISSWETYINLNFVIEFLPPSLVLIAILFIAKQFRKYKIAEYIGFISFFFVNILIFIIILNFIGRVSFSKGEINGFPSYSVFNAIALLGKYPLSCMVFVIVITVLFRKMFLYKIGILYTAPDNTIDRHPNIIEFNIYPTEIISGETITIEWAVKNSNNVTITGLGDVNSNGKKVVKLKNINNVVSKNIIITAQNENYTKTQSITIKFKSDK